MFSTIFLLMLVSFYLLYNTSRRVKKRRQPAYMTYMAQRVQLSRILSVAAMVLALILLIWKLGTGSGAFGFVVVLMCTGSLIVTLAPFRFLRLAHLAGIYLVLVIFEILVF